MIDLGKATEATMQNSLTGLQDNPPTSQKREV